MRSTRQAWERSIPTVRHNQGYVHTSCWALMWTHIFFQVHTPGFGTVPMPGYKASTLYSGTKWHLDTWSTQCLNAVLLIVPVPRQQCLGTKCEHSPSFFYSLEIFQYYCIIWLCIVIDNITSRKTQDEAIYCCLYLELFFSVLESLRLWGSTVFVLIKWSLHSALHSVVLCGAMSSLQTFSWEILQCQVYKYGCKHELSVGA